MTKENASLCITPGKEQGMNCQTDSPNAPSPVILKLLPGPETDLPNSCTPSWVLGLQEGVTALALSPPCLKGEPIRS